MCAVYFIISISKMMVKMAIIFLFIDMDIKRKLKKPPYLKVSNDTP